MKLEHIYLKPDSKNRVSLNKLTKGRPDLYKATKIKGKIVLEPITEIDTEIEWIFKPENKALLEKIKKGLSQEANIEIDLSSFEEGLKD